MLSYLLFKLEEGKMAKKVGLKIGIGVLLLIGAYFLYKKIKDRVDANNIQNGETEIVETEDGIEVVDTASGNVLSTYTNTGNDMSFPLAYDETCNDYIVGGCYEYDNVAKLQKWLLLNMASGSLSVDGQFGLGTKAAVIEVLTNLNLEEYGYNLLAIRDYVTEEFYLDNIAIIDGEV